MLKVDQYFVDVVGISFLACDFVFEIVRGVLNTLVIVQIYVGKIILPAYVCRKRELNVYRLFSGLKAIVFSHRDPVIWEMMQRAGNILIVFGKFAQRVE